VSSAKDQTIETLRTDAPSPDEAASPAGARRRVPSLVLGLGGAALTTAYGVAAMHLRMGAPLVMLGLGGLTLVLSGVALWRVLDPLSRGGLATRLAPRAPQRLRELEREKQLVLKAIKEIELDYQMRKIAEPDYKDMLDRYRRRAMRLISEIEEGDNFRPLIERELRDRLAARLEAGETAEPGAGAPSAAAAHDKTTCPACGTSNDDDAQFCKKCGGKLSS
jgi:hypothetical protein